MISRLLAYLAGIISPTIDRQIQTQLFHVLYYTDLPVLLGAPTGSGKTLVIDEIHLLGEERGAVLEAIVSRTRLISRYVEEAEHEEDESVKTKQRPETTRIIGLSTMLANPLDLADWMGIDTKSHGPSALRGLYNFRPSVRPVPTKVSQEHGSTHLSQTPDVQ